MTLISLVCLLALSSCAFGRSTYGSGYGTSFPQISNIVSSMREQTRSFLPTIQISPPVPTQFQSGYGQQQIVDTSVQPLTRTLETFPTQSYGQGYGSARRLPQFEQQQVQQVQVILTAADILCRGHVAETVIPLEDGRRWVVCLDESKGVELACPKGLYYNQASNRCERKLGPLESPCAIQPCLNGGQCVPTDFSYQCQCTAGFEGQTCELDARVCQTQQPCGQSPDARCQSFRWGAALTYMCILQDGLAYGLSPAQAQQSPCQNVDGPQALAFSNKGFIMCDGERMFIESCPGRTIWDDLHKTCVWDDTQVIAGIPQQEQQGYGQSSYGQERSITPKLTYGGQYTKIRHHEKPRHFQSYGGQQEQKPMTFPVQTGYGGQQEQRPLTFPVQTGYGGQQEQKPMTFPVQTGYGGQEEQKPLTFPVQTGYGGQEEQKPMIFPVQTGYGGQQEQKVINWQKPQQELLRVEQTGYGGQREQKPLTFLSRPEVVPVKQLSGY